MPVLNLKRRLRPVESCPQPETKAANCPQPEIIAGEARRVLTYYPETGAFVWKVSTGPNAAVGNVAGWIGLNGYRYIQVNGRAYRSSRLAFLIMTGQWPLHEVDHIDRDRTNDRWANLRQCSHAENSQNRGLRSDNTSGIPGVRWKARSAKWSARIGIGGKRYHLGLFRSKEDAVAAYQAAKVRLHAFAAVSDTR